MSIADKIARFQAARDAQVAVLTAKGVDVPEGAGFEDFPSLTEAIASGGNAHFSGEIVTDAETPIYTAGLTLNLGLPSRAKWFFMWFDRDDYEALPSVTNDKYAVIVMFPVTISEITPWRSTATALIPDTADRFFFVASYHSTTSATENGYAISSWNMVGKNLDKWTANEDGTITISRFSTTATYLLPGTYHWIAVC